MQFRRLLILVIGIMFIALAAYAGNLNTAGKCPSGEACELGHVNTTSFTIVTDGTGDGEVMLPADSIGASEVAENAVKGDAFGAMSDKIVLCGQDANSGTIYGGPAVAEYLGNGTEFAIGGTACNAYDSATEATADAPILAGFPSFKVTGMFCETSSDAANDQVFTLRSAASGLTPAVTCTVLGAGAATSCATVTSTTTDIAAGATIAVRSVNTEDLSAQDFWCEVYFSIKAL